MYSSRYALSPPRLYNHKIHIRNSMTPIHMPNLKECKYKYIQQYISPILAIISIFSHTLPNYTQPVNEPAKAQNRKHTHPKHHAQCSLFHRSQRPITSSTNKVRQRRVGLRRVHPKRIRILDRKISCLRRRTDITRRIVDNQRVDIRQQRIR